VSITAGGEVTTHFVMRSFKEFKTFAVRFDPQFFKQEDNFDFRDYVDITKRIKRDSARPNKISTCSYLIDFRRVIPSAVLKLIGFDYI
jgi:hypothetical protein